MEISEILVTFVITSSIGLVLALTRACYKSKCSSVDLCGCISIVRNTEIEVKKEPLIENVELLNVETEQLSQNNTIDLEKDSADILLKSVEVDYKKMTLNKLKEIALEKGLIDETTKLKKLDLLKLLSN